MHLTQIYIRTVACKMCLEMSSCAWWHLGCSMFNVHILYECQNHLTKYYRWIVTMNIVFGVASFGLRVLNAFYRWWWFRAGNSNEPERIRELTYRMHWMPQNNSTGMRCAYNALIWSDMSHVQFSLNRCECQINFEMTCQSGKVCIRKIINDC